MCFYHFIISIQTNSNEGGYQQNSVPRYRHIVSSVTPALLSLYQTFPLKTPLSTASPKVPPTFPDPKVSPTVSPTLLWTPSTSLLPEISPLWRVSVERQRYLRRNYNKIGYDEQRLTFDAVRSSILPKVFKICVFDPVPGGIVVLAVPGFLLLE